jgi:hypothetical protein
MNHCYLVNAETINAYYAHGLLYLSASGHAECSQFVAISETMLTIFPPEYQITTCACPQIGSFPYDVHAWFELAEQVETVTVHTASGVQKVDVKPFPADLTDDIATPSLLTDKPAAGEVVGISPNSFDLSRAITDAVNKLQKAYPGEVSATVTDIGVVATGSPVGIAYLYVKMKQEGTKRTTKRR